MTEPLTKAEYLELQERVMLIARLAYRTDVDRMLLAIEKADSIGPFVDPTLWMRGHDKLAIIREFAQGVKRLKTLVEANRDRIFRAEQDGAHNTLETTL